MIALKESSALQRAAYAWSIGVGMRIAEKVMAGETVGTGLKLRFTLARWLALNNTRKLIGIHRARFCVTGRPHLARTGEVVHGAGCSHAGGMGHDGNLRGHRPGAGHPHEAGLHWPGRRFQRSAARPATGEILVRGTNVFMGYLNLPEKRPKPSTPMDGCIPATSARWTMKASSASPTA